MKFAQAFLKTIWFYSLIGGIYIAGNAWFHPESLSWQLTHLTPWIREDTFGIVCFVTSAISYTWLQCLPTTSSKSKSDA
jgi:hypothetical protein